MQKITKNDITGVILAGGQARRMKGQDKGLILFNGKPLIEYVIKVLKPQVGRLLINANRNHDKYSKYGFDIISDELSGYCGPLAGMASALNRTKTPYLITVPCDSPFISDDLVARLSLAMANKDTEISVAHNGERLQPVFCMMKKRLISSMNAYLAKGERKIDKWLNLHSVAIADLSDIPRTFENFNSQEDIAVSKKTPNDKY